MPPTKSGIPKKEEVDKSQSLIRTEKRESQTDGHGAQALHSQTAREGTQAPVSQTATEGTPPPCVGLEEEEENPYETVNACIVTRRVACTSWYQRCSVVCVMKSKAEKEVFCAFSQANMRQREGKERRRKIF